MSRSAAIDGLRGVAVLAVLLFHARALGFAGGFVGVDVFFVISGYLITTQIRRAQSADGFDLAHFYERRARRLVPALFGMLALTSLAAWILLPGDFSRYARSVLAALVFSSNFLFWHWDGYFRLATESTPLLHTWSLGVEAQFYLLWPIGLLWLQRRDPRWGRAVVAAIGLTSLTYSVWATRTDAGAAYYSPLSRAWEFVAGAWLAMDASAVRSHSPRMWRSDVLALAGLAMIGASVSWLSPASAFPGVNALAPCLGALLVIPNVQKHGSAVGRLLSVTPLATIGLASYSIYLWHWPLAILATYYVLDPRVAGTVRVAAVAAAVPLGWLSWRYVETPWLRTERRRSSRSFLVSTMAVASGLALFGVGVYAAHGIPQRFDAVVRRLSADEPVPVYLCANQSLRAMEARQLCRIGDPRTRPSFILWGDSHASMYAAAIDRLAQQHGVSGYALTAFGCPPLLAFTVQGDAMRDCQARNELIVAIAAETRPRVVILAGHWSAYFAPPGRRTDNAAGGPERARKHVAGFSREDLVRSLDATVERLAESGAHPYFVEDVPQTPPTSRAALAKAHLVGTRDTFAPSADGYARDNAVVASVAAEFARERRIELVSPWRLLCGPETCRTLDDRGAPLYSDAHHLNETGARAVSSAFGPLFDRLTWPRGEQDD